MSLLSSVGKIIGTAATAVAKTAGRAIITPPTIAANVIAPKSQIAQTLKKVYGLDTALKDAGTTASIAGIIGTGAGLGAAAKAGTSLLNAKVVGSALAGAAGSGLTTAPKTSEKILTNAPSALISGIDIAAKNPTAAIAALSALPIVAYTGYKSAGLVGGLISNKLGGNKSSLTNVTQSAGGLLGDKDILAQPAVIPSNLPSITPSTDKTPLLTAGGAGLQPATSDIAEVPEGYDTPILAKDERRKKRRKAKPVQPIRVYNRVGVDVRNSNIFKLIKH